MALTDEDKTWLTGQLSNIEGSLSRSEQRFVGVEGILSRSEERFVRIEGSLSRVEERFVGVEGILSRSEERFVRIEGSLSRVEERFVGVEGLLSRFEERFIRLEARMSHLEEKVAQMEERFNIALERVETSLLTEFHKWASPAEMRAKSHAAAIRALDSEVEFISDRVTKLERPSA